MRGDPIPVFGAGGTRRDYTFVDDVVSGVVAAMSYSGSNFEVINLGNNATISLDEMIRQLEHALGRPAIIDRQPEQSGDVPQTWAAIEKARSQLNYEPATRFEDGVRRFVAWLEINS